MLPQVPEGADDEQSSDGGKSNHAYEAPELERCRLVDEVYVLNWAPGSDGYTAKTVVYGQDV
jgi:hypothetical protein